MAGDAGGKVEVDTGSNIRGSQNRASHTRPTSRRAVEEPRRADVVGAEAGDGGEGALGDGLAGGLAQQQRAHAPPPQRGRHAARGGDDVWRTTPRHDASRPVMAWRGAAISAVD